ncbi:MAG: DNA polymerase IV, partial [Calditrichia bacterium]|nr:DNA polymerase IV [Calditrichia bacterium]
LWGIGKQTYQLLLKMGVKTVAQLRSYPREILEKKFGKMGDHIYRMARGEDERDVTPFESVKSVSNEMTFNEDIIDLEIILKTIFGLAEKVGGRLRRSKIKGHTIHLKIRFADFKTNTRSHTLKKSTHLTEDIFSTVEALLEEFLPLESFVRLVGVGVSHLENESGSQLSIWDIADEKKLKMEKVMDQIQDKFGKNIIKHAESLSAKSRKKD